MTQPLDRNCELPALGKLDAEKGEFWVKNPFQIPEQKKNLSAYERNQLFVSFLGKSFFNASFASQADIDSDSRAVIAADFDGDDAPDLLVVSAGGGPLRLFRNRYPQQHRLIVKLRGNGTTSNRTAIGTHVVAECGNRKIYRDVFAPNGFLGTGPAQLSIGMGRAEKIDVMTIRWPDGEMQMIRDISPGTIAVEQGKSSYQRIRSLPKNPS